LVLLFEELGYRVELTGWKYAEEQFDLRFVNSGGGPDRIKVEINYLERLPVLGTRQGRISHPFSDLDPVEVLTLTREELFAGKLRALVQRGTARDLFDAHLISTDQERTDMVRLRATFLLHMAMVEIDGRAISLGAVRKIDEKGARDVLVPMLPRSAKVNLSEMMSGAESLICPMLVLTDKGREFFDIFYGEGKIKGAGLFRGIDMEVDLSRHPALKWRLQQLREKGGPP
ncbi:MAG: nucleotidyl transferase AbiEii/AbiGii toxin family protein, partial [Methanomassiliicoccales archaeon]